MSIETPDWYVLKDPGDTSVNVNEWIVYATTRMNRLIEEDQWTFHKSLRISEEEWEQIKSEDMGGHILLRLAVSKDPRLISWLVEVEGDLFEFRFVSSPALEEKIVILKELYSEENVKTMDEIGKMFDVDLYRKFNLADVPSKSSRYAKGKFGSSVRDLDKRVGIKFHKIPSVVSAKKVLLYQGWGIVRLADVRLAVKREFEKQLKNIIEKSKEIVDNDQALENTIKPITDEITKIARETRLSGDLSKLGIPEGEDIFSKPEVFPPCIQELIGILQSKGHLAHVENWQLGTFLKKAGMSLENQLRFWYNNSIDNVGWSFDEFVHRVGYQIRHIYGKAGGGIDYSPPSCKTCIDGYFCYWAHKKLEDLSEDIRVRFKDRNQEIIEQTIEDISRIIINQKFQTACARYFTLLTGWRMSGNRVNHMLNYTKQAYKRFHSKKPSPADEQKEDEKKEEET